MPKTLDETYDRVLLTLPEEDQQFVHHALQLILHHNNVYGGDSTGGIPCAVLIRVVERSIAGLTSKQNDRFYNHETLRELCGCLINVTQYNPRSIDVIAETYRSQVARPPYEVLTVSFAHYTVQEYLGSNRISTAYANSCKEELEQTFMEMMFAESLQVKPNERWDCMVGERYRCDLFEALEAYFLIYCVVSVLYSLRRFSARISRHDTLSKLSMVLLDPTKVHFHFLKLVANASELWGGTGKFWCVTWKSEPRNTDTVHLLNLSLLANISPEYLLLVKRFLQGKNNKDFLRTRLIFSNCGEIFDNNHNYDGSILEIFAQSAFEVPGRLRLLLEHGTGLFDPSVILLLFIGCHQCHPNDDCSSHCMVKRLLDLGADPNMNGCWATPLQIAVHCRDLIAISILLEAGADVNPVENSDGIAWEDQTLMSRFNVLHGASPLYIHRHFDPYENEDIFFWRNRTLNPRKGDLEQVEAILLQYGAKSYQQT